MFRNVDASAVGGKRDVYEFAVAANWRINVLCATRLLLAITTDTGSFQGLTMERNPASHIAAARLLSLARRIALIIRKRPISRVR